MGGVSGDGVVVFGCETESCLLDVGYVLYRCSTALRKSLQYHSKCMLKYLMTKTMRFREPCGPARLFPGCNKLSSYTERELHSCTNWANNHKAERLLLAKIVFVSARTRDPTRSLFQAYLAIGFPQTLSSIRFGSAPRRSSSAGSDSRFCARLRLSSAGVEAPSPGDKTLSPLSSRRSFRRFPRPMKADGGPSWRILLPSRLTSTRVRQRFSPARLPILFPWGKQASVTRCGYKYVNAQSRPQDLSGLDSKNCVSWGCFST